MATIRGMAAEIRNKENKEKERQQNKMFRDNPRILYRKIMNEDTVISNPPKQEDLEQFWRKIYETKAEHQENEELMKTVTRKNEDKPAMKEIHFNTLEIKNKLKTLSNHKTPGPDKLTNFWLKEITALLPHYEKAFNRILEGKEPTPEWLTTGTTTLIPKSKETNQPNKYRPICCLSTTYKLLTGMLADRLYDHLYNNQLMEDEQKGGKRETLGTKDHLLLNKTILEDCRRRGRNISMAWIDYKKAYDSVPHSWILRCLELYKADKKLIQLIRNQMGKWKTTIKLQHKKGKLVVRDVHIKKGIFQGDSLSPILFCLALDPLSKKLKDSDIGYNLNNGRSRIPEKTVNHLLFMDDLKLYAESNQKLTELLKIVYDFSEDIKMQFGLDKCSTCHIKKGKKVKKENIELNPRIVICEIGDDQAYKYLGIEENVVIEHRKMREKIKKEYLKRLKKICGTQLTNKNKITAVNQLALPVLNYSFGIIDWPQGELNSLNIKPEKYLPVQK